MAPTWPSPPNYTPEPDSSKYPPPSHIAVLHPDTCHTNAYDSEAALGATPTRRRTDPSSAEHDTRWRRLRLAHTGAARANVRVRHAGRRACWSVGGFLKSPRNLFCCIGLVIVLFIAGLIVMLIVYDKMRCKAGWSQKGCH